MREGTPSLTAQRVAAYRAGFERLPVPYGDPGADERLTRDVAGSRPFASHEPMARQHVMLDAGERQRLSAAIVARPVVFNAWAFATGREALSVAAGRLPELRARAEQIAA